MSTSPVTERDFRMPQFRDADPADYEFRSDGKIVRKDRWERGVVSLVQVLGLDRNSFEIDDLVKRALHLVELLGADPNNGPYDLVEHTRAMLASLGHKPVTEDDLAGCVEQDDGQ